MSNRAMRRVFLLFQTSLTHDFSSPFALSLQNPFTAKSHCFGFRKKLAKNRGNPICPLHFGRSKVLVRPSVHDEIHTHGNLQPDPSKGIVHFHTNTAHMKEWPSIFAKYAPRVRPPRDFTVEREEEVNIHNLKVSYQPNPNGTFNIYFDSGLEPWMEYVSTRRKATDRRTF